MNLDKGWLGRQFDRISRDINDWPEWMKREAGFTNALQSESELERENVGACDLKDKIVARSGHDVDK